MKVSYVFILQTAEHPEPHFLIVFFVVEADDVVVDAGFVNGVGKKRGFLYTEGNHSVKHPVHVVLWIKSMHVAVGYWQIVLHLKTYFGLDGMMQNDMLFKYYSKNAKKQDGRPSH